MEEHGVRVGGGVREAADGGRSSEAGGRRRWPQPTGGSVHPSAPSPAVPPPTVVLLLPFQI